MASNIAPTSSPTMTDNDRLMIGTTKQNQLESTLYMPSMYDSDDDNDEEGTDRRDERMSNDRQEVLRTSKFSLKRCLAWSIDDQEDERISTSDEHDVDGEPNGSLGVISEGGAVQSFGSFHSALVDSVNSRELHVHNGVRPVHWEEQVTIDKNLDSFLPTSTSSKHFVSASQGQSTSTTREVHIC
jgi:hypothetical protein